MEQKYDMKINSRTTEPSKKAGYNAISSLLHLKKEILVCQELKSQPIKKIRQVAMLTCRTYVMNNRI
ncbi:hypothetical protein C799_03430 [Bacteroides thetaiotaomicron dnLKV9]|uniref:Uncharacterized protein n=1 Tax=Bacteroides thetaiotaomicron dnLKV9 TaxID=1235785 RepID=R9H6L2_BACT4|nr:hypothetical protein C799_03430 [Bacteroides thetaiotaomicron dnLKV9]